MNPEDNSVENPQFIYFVLNISQKNPATQITKEFTNKIATEFTKESTRQSHEKSQ